MDASVFGANPAPDAASPLPCTTRMVPLVSSGAGVPFGSVPARSSVHPSPETCTPSRREVGATALVVGTPPTSTTALPGDTDIVAASITGWSGPDGVTIREAGVSVVEVGAGAEEPPPPLPDPPPPALALVTVTL